jgi:DNA-directed RNA polymerase specialized sigma24 family protein
MREVECPPMADARTAVTRLRVADEEFARQLDALKGMIASLLRQQIGALCEDTIQDLAQEVVIRCWERRDRIRRLPAYVRKTVSSVVIDFRRRPEEKLASFEHLCEQMGASVDGLIEGTPWQRREARSAEELLEHKHEQSMAALCCGLAVERSPRDAALILGYLQGLRMDVMLPRATPGERTAAYRRIVRALEWARQWFVQWEDLQHGKGGADDGRTSEDASSGGTHRSRAGGGRQPGCSVHGGIVPGRERAVG